MLKYKRRLELEKRLEASAQAEADIEGIKAFCESAKHNLGYFTIKQKILALEALDNKVWLDKDTDVIRLYTQLLLFFYRLFLACTNSFSIREESL